MIFSRDVFGTPGKYGFLYFLRYLSGVLNTGYSGMLQKQIRKAKILGGIFITAKKNAVQKQIPPHFSYGSRKILPTGYRKNFIWRHLKIKINTR